MRTGAAVLLAAEEPKWTDQLSAWSSLGSGTIAVLALIAATIAAVATVRTNRAQSEQLRQLELDRRSELASKFAVWIDLKMTRGRDSQGFLEEPYLKAMLMYHNSSGLPVYDVLTKCTINKKETEWSFINASPTESPTRLDDEVDFLHEVVDIARADFLVTEPKTDKIRTFKSILATDKDAGIRLMVEMTTLEISFRDGNGRAWHRDRHGQLTELHETYKFAGSTVQRIMAEEDAAESPESTA